MLMMQLLNLYKQTIHPLEGIAILGIYKSFLKGEIIKCSKGRELKYTTAFVINKAAKNK